jgi:hypothetical protein
MGFLGQERTVVPTLAVVFAAFGAAPWILWFVTFQAKENQSGRVRRFQQYFSPSLSLHAVEVIGFLCAVVALVFGIAAFQARGWPRGVGLLVSILSAVVLALYLFARL